VFWLGSNSANPAYPVVSATFLSPVSLWYRETAHGTAVPSISSPKIRARVWLGRVCGCVRDQKGTSNAISFCCGARNNLC